ncbi:hypothetical protein GMMP1_1230011 [Candidatus Magnetomoraceae bacterium gMMP-1]
MLKENFIKKINKIRLICYLNFYFTKFYDKSPIIFSRSRIDNFLNI